MTAVAITAYIIFAVTTLWFGVWRPCLRATGGLIRRPSPDGSAPPVGPSAPGGSAGGARSTKGARP